MEETKNYLPSNWEALGVWHENWTNTLPTLAAKYAVRQAYLDQVGKDNAWLQYWVRAKMAAKQLERQMTDYVDDIFKKEIGSAQPAEPAFALPAGTPQAIPTGLRERIREAAGLIKKQTSIYTESDGELLGIVGTSQSRQTDQLTAESSFKTLPDFNLEAAFGKQGTDGMRYQFRYKGGEWQHLGDTGQSPRTFKITPQEAGKAEQIELRCILLEKYQPVGSWSPIYTQVIAA